MTGFGGLDTELPDHASNALLRREEQLRLATEAADIGLWDVDLLSEQLYWPPRVKAMFGISAGIDVSMSDFYAGLHPEDRGKTGEAFAAAVDPKRRALYDVEYRAVGKEDGVVRWVAAKGRGIFDDSGRCVRVIGTAMDISVRRSTERSLQLSEQKLREADRKKDEFLATLAHELRNPLAPIGNAAALLQHPSIERGKVTHFAQMIERQTKAMAVLLDDLLEVARISTGKVQLKKQVVSVASLIESSLEPVRPALESRKHGLRVEMDDAAAAAVLEVDPVRVSQVLTNLLTNSIKYSDPGTEVVLRARVDPLRIIYEVEDSGIGLASEHLPTIFEMFAQVPHANGRSAGGLGIGLAVAKAMVEMHGGEILASSAGLGKGCKFTVLLPRNAASQQKLEPGSSSGEASARSRAVVVVADDNVDAAESLAEMLKLEGYEVHVAHDGLRTLQLATEIKPAAFFLDLGMPGADGLEVARRLRASEDSDLVLIATTGWGQPEDRRRTTEAGFDLHLTKPIDVSGAARELAIRLNGLPQTNKLCQ